MKSLLFSLLLSAAIAASPLSAKEFTWDGGGDQSSWNDPRNWAGDKGFPGKGDAAIFPDSAQADIKKGIPADIMRIDVKDDAELELDQESTLHLSGGDGNPPLRSGTRSRIIIGKNFTLAMDETPENITPGSLINMGTVVVGK